MRYDQLADLTNENFAFSILALVFKCAIIWRANQKIGKLESLCLDHHTVYISFSIQGGN